ncbi:hypothetical protein Ahy_A07g036069 isoform B [Arachis hypogaea]|nr:hypothetical protein Ahy_A07g036069 isoform B [Arachis hypogaea]
MRKKTVLASESWWTDKIKINPEFAKFKNEGPKSLDRLEQCFKDIVATGYSAWAPSEDPNPEEFNQNNEGFESGGDMNYTNEFIEEDIANYTVVQSPTREKRRKTSKKKVEKRAGIVSRLQDSLDHILVGVESKAATKGDDPYSIENCIKLLRKLPATKGDDPYSVFNRLCNDLVLNYGLKSTRSVSGEEMVATFLYMLGQGASYRMLEERFQHSGETIFRQFHHVLSCVKKLAKNIIRPIDPSFGDTPKYIMDNDRYWPYFKDCIGAIDGTHIAIHVHQDEQVRFIGRKGNTTTNVMAVCDFNMCFTFIWAGCKGSAHDTRIFMEALRTKKLNFPHPPEG